MEKNPVFTLPHDDDDQDKLVHMKQPSPGPAAPKKPFGHVYAVVAVLAILVLAVVALVAIIVFRPTAITSECSTSEELLRTEMKSLKQTLADQTANDSRLFAKISKLQQTIEGISNILTSSQVQQLNFNEELQQQLDDSDLTIQLQLNNSVQKIQDLKVQLNASLQLTKEQKLSYLDDFFQYTSTSYCKKIFEQDSTAPTGTYWLNTKDGMVSVICDFDVQLPPTSPIGGWQEIANVIMSNPNDSCPSPLIETASRPRRCKKRPNEPGCQSILFTTRNVPFSKLCGRVVGYGRATVDAFHSIHGVCGRSGCETVDDPYVDGISVTYSTDNTRSHVWSLATSVGPRCPCGSSAFSAPSFVGDDYYCEVAENSNTPLWDGEGCTGSCCENPNLPWFCREFNQPIVTNNIEVRVCTDQHRADEDIEVDLLKIYIQ